MSLRIALVASGLQALMPISWMETRRSVDRKLSVEKIRLLHLVTHPVEIGAVFSMIWPAVQGWPNMHRLGGCLLEWQRAQFSANTILPRSSLAGSGGWALP